MRKFKGFEESESLTALPDSFFGRILGEVADLSELKIVLTALWQTQHMDGPVHPLRITDFDAQTAGLTPSEIQQGLMRAVEDGILLVAGAGSSSLYFLNSPRGRAAAAAIAKGAQSIPTGAVTGPLDQTNVFKLYEENIGPLTPLIADALRDAEGAYPEEWLADAIEVAVANNKRSWAYCKAILKRWKDEGRAEKQNRRDDKAARQRDVEKKIRKFIDG